VSTPSPLLAAPRVHSDFVLQRLHSVTGVVPLGAWLGLHLLAQAPMAWGGPEAWTRFSIFTKGPVAGLLTAILVGFPLLFHAGFGVLLLRRRGLTAGRLPLAGNVVQTLQLICSAILAVFLCLHLTQLRVVPFIRQLPLDVQTVQRALRPLLALDVYVAGVLAASFHLWAGIWTMLVRFGWTQSRASQRGSAWVCLACGVVMALLGLHVAAAFHDVRYVVP